MSITCKFELSRISNIYYSGEDITGTITICSLKQRQIEGKQIGREDVFVLEI